MNRMNIALLAAGLAMTCGMRAAAAEAGATKPALPPAATKQGVTFATDIKPLFEASCVRCHSGQKAKARLHLDSLEGVLAGSEDGKVIIAGNSEKSPIVLAVARVNPKTAMPPEPRQRRGQGQGGSDRPPQARNTTANDAHSAPMADGTQAPARPPGGQGGSGEQRGQGPRGNQGPPPKPLTAEQVGLVRAWIEQGAK